MKPFIVLLCLLPLVALSHNDNSTCHREESDLCSRMINFVSSGCTIPDDVSITNMKNLADMLGNEDVQREAVMQEKNQLESRALIPLMEIVMKDNRSSDAAEELIKGRSKAFQRMNNANLTLPALETTIISGSVQHILGAPYPLVWKASGGNGHPSAFSSGDIHIDAENDGWASGGVGVSFRPMKSLELVIIKPSVWYSWRWHVSDCWLFCSQSRTNGFYGIFVQKFDLNGNHISDTDFRQALWNHDDTDVGGIRFTDPPYLAVSSDFTYNIWVWFSAHASGHDAIGILDAHVGATVIEEFV
jgi:hypothetical protein